MDGLDTEARLEQVAKIAQNARTSWFGLLALLVFVGVTLMGHQDSDFFAFGAKTELPLVNIAVPPVSFFVVAPALTAALYVYLHIYLQGLWIALAKCPARIDRGPLEESAYPTMLCTAALVVRRWVRHETGEPVEGSRHATVAISLLMVWLLGPIVLGVLWWRSMPYHSEWVTLWIAAWLWVALIAGGEGLLQLIHAMRSARPRPSSGFRSPSAIAKGLVHLVLAVAFAASSWVATESGYAGGLIAARMEGAELSRKPRDWLHYEIWQEDWEQRFRVREGLPAGGPIDEWPEETLKQFRREPPQRWTTLTGALDAPDLGEKDLRRANLEAAFVSGADLSGARLEGANLREARLEGANLSNAQLEGAMLRKARLEGANLRNAVAEHADFSRAVLKEANFSSAELKEADFQGARMQRAVLHVAQMEGAVLRSAWLQHAKLYSANLKGANLRRARLMGADLNGASLEDAVLRAANLEGAELRAARLQRADLIGTHLAGADFTRARMQGADLSNAQLEGADLSQAQLEGAILREARLAGAMFYKARLQGADLSDATGLSASQFDRACGDEHTQLPEGIWLPTCTE